MALKTPTFAIKLCALIDYMKDKYTFGYGITLGQGVWFVLIIFVQMVIYRV